MAKAYLLVLDTIENYQIVQGWQLEQNNFCTLMEELILVEIFISQYLKPGGNMILMETFRFIQLQQVLELAKWQRGTLKGYVAIYWEVLGQR